jgi:hypothetical protein
MTISVDDRKAAMTRVLVRLAEMFWDEPRGYFGYEDLIGTSPLETTIAELKAQRYVEEVMFVSNPRPYLLTHSGWYGGSTAKCSRSNSRASISRQARYPRCRHHEERRSPHLSDDGGVADAPRSAG